MDNVIMLSGPQFKADIMRAAKFTERKNTLPVLSHVHVQQMPVDNPPKLRITEDDGEISYVSLAIFVEANAEDEETVADVRALAPGEHVMLGGGACPLVRVDRVR